MVVCGVDPSVLEDLRRSVTESKEGQIRAHEQTIDLLKRNLELNEPEHQRDGDHPQSLAAARARQQGNAAFPSRQQGTCKSRARNENGTETPHPAYPSHGSLRLLPAQQLVRLCAQVLHRVRRLQQQSDHAREQEEDDHDHERGLDAEPIDREAGFTLARLVREAGQTSGLARLRLSSIEVNHVNDELVAALRETPTLARHLHIPLQSGDDRVLRAMARRYTSDTYLRRLAGLEDFNLTTDVIVGFPGEDELAFRRTLLVVRLAQITKVHVFPYSARPGTQTADADPVPSATKKERSARLRAASHAACLERWRSKVGTEDVVLVDRPGRGYGDDYSPWLLDAPVGELVRVRAAAVSEEGILAA